MTLPSPAPSPSPRVATTGRGFACLAIVLGVVLWLGASRDARAAETEVTATTAAQGYESISPWGDPRVTRRRFLQTLGLGVYRIGADSNWKPGDPEYFVKLRLRLDVDFGVQKDEVTFLPNSTTFVPGLEAAPIDLMYGYIEGRNLAHGLLGFRLGRQYTSDVLGWWAFDGGLVRLTTPAYVAFEAYGGLEERGGLPLSTPRFEQQGVWRGDRLGMDLTTYPDFLQSAIAPAYGIAVETAGVTWIHARADYRKVLNTGSVATFSSAAGATPEMYDATRTSSEKVGVAMDASAMNIGGIKGGLAYDLFNSLFSTYYASADWYGPAGITVGADYEYFRPTFDGDSIFNFFAHQAMRTITGRMAVDSPFGLSVAWSGGVRQYYSEPEDLPKPSTPATDLSKTTDLLGSLSARYRWETGRVDLRGMFDRGDRGRRQGADLSGEKTFENGRWLALARVSFYDWTDALRPIIDSTSFGYVVGGGFRPGQTTDLRLEWEHETNHLVGQRYRVLALLNLSVMP